MPGAEEFKSAMIPKSCLMTRIRALSILIAEESFGSKVTVSWTEARSFGSEQPFSR